MPITSPTIRLLKPSMIVDEQRDHRQRQADGEIAAEQRRDDAERRAREMNRRGLRSTQIV